MSFEAKYNTKIKFLDRDFMKEAIEILVRDKGLKIMDKKSFHLDSLNPVKHVFVKGLCIKAPDASLPADLFMNKNNELELHCGEYDKEKYLRYLSILQKQCYPAVVITHKIGVPVKYNDETRKYELEQMVTR